MTEKAEAALALMEDAAEKETAATQPGVTVVINERLPINDFQTRDDSLDSTATNIIGVHQSGNIPPGILLSAAWMSMEGPQNLSLPFGAVVELAFRYLHYRAEAGKQ